MKHSKKLHSCLHLDGSMVVPVADALRRATSGMRKAALQIAAVCCKSERTAANYLAGLTEMGATDLIRVAREFREVRDLVIDAITPNETTLLEDVADLLALQARVAARFQEEFGVNGDVPLSLDDLVLQMAGRARLSPVGEAAGGVQGGTSARRGDDQGRRLLGRADAGNPGAEGGAE